MVVLLQDENHKEELVLGEARYKAKPYIVDELGEIRNPLG